MKICIQLTRDAFTNCILNLVTQVIFKLKCTSKNCQVFILSVEIIRKL